MTSPQKTSSKIAGSTTGRGKSRKRGPAAAKAAVETDPAAGAPEGRGSPVEAPRYSKTPMFEATHAPRYHRQALIKEIEAQTGRQLLCYVSGDKRQIERDDTLGLMDLLHNVDPGADLDLMLHTAGGDVDAADKLLQIIFSRLGKAGRLRVIIPDYAKSAGTLIALGAHQLVMSDSSELGTIDPQFVLNDQHGNAICTSVTAYLDAFTEYSDALRKNPGDPVAEAMLNQFDPVVIRKFEGYSKRARDIAERLLREKNANPTAIANDLLTERRWKSHGERIGYEDARQALELDVEYRAPSDPLWKKLWLLYCLQRLQVEQDKKIFESAWVSQIFER